MRTTNPGNRMLDLLLAQDPDENFDEEEEPSCICGRGECPDCGYAGEPLADGEEESLAFGLNMAMSCYGGADL